MGKKYFTLSFDDGLEQDKKLIALMKKYGIRGSFNLNGGLLGDQKRIGRIGNYGILEFPETDRIKTRVFKNHPHNRIPRDEIAQVYEGFEIASHGFRHIPFRGMKDSALRLEIQKDLDTLSDLAGYPVTGHVYPGGGHTEAAEQYLREKGILYGRSVLGKSSFCFPENPYQYVPTRWFGAKDIFEQLEKYIHMEVNERNMLFCVWGHGHELDFETERCNWNHMEKLLSFASENSELTFCTLSEAFQGNLLSRKS